MRSGAPWYLDFRFLSDRRVMRRRQNATGVADPADSFGIGIGKGLRLGVFP